MISLSRRFSFHAATKKRLETEISTFASIRVLGRTAICAWKTIAANAFLESHTSCWHALRNGVQRERPCPLYTTRGNDLGHATPHHTSVIHLTRRRAQHENKHGAPARYQVVDSAATDQLTTRGSTQIGTRCRTSSVYMTSEFSVFFAIRRNYA